MRRANLDRRFLAMRRVGAASYHDQQRDECKCDHQETRRCAPKKADLPLHLAAQRGRARAVVVKIDGAGFVASDMWLKSLELLSCP